MDSPHIIYSFNNRYGGNFLFADEDIKKVEKFAGKYRIEPNRSQFRDYSLPGIYFLTICIENHKCILGEIINKKMHLSDYGKIVENEIVEIPGYHKRIVLDQWIIMPDHIHLLIQLTGYDFDNGLNANDWNLNMDGWDEYNLKANTHN